MKKVPATIMAIASIPFITLGLLFMIAAIQNPARFPIAIVLLLIGAVLLIAGIKRLRRLADIDPATLKTNAVDLARRLGGEVTVSQFRAEYRIPRELAVDVLEDLVADGTCARENRENRVVYVFVGLMPALAEKVCPYCGAEFPVRSALRKCPNCGASIEIQKT